MPRKVSIIIPCFNAARWLKQTIASVRQQGWPNLEIIVVNDGSTDDSAALLEQIGGDDLKVFHQENGGPSAAQNFGLQKAKGDLINFLDADDLLLPGKLAAQIIRLDGRVDAIATGAWARFSDDIKDAQFVPEPVWSDMDPVQFNVTSWTGGGMMHGAQWLIPRAILDASGPWDPRLTLINDLEFFTRVTLKAKAILFCPESRSGYRVHASGSLSQAHSNEAWVSARLSTKLATQYLLDAEYSGRTRRAVADCWQRLIHSAYPYAPDLVEEGERMIALHGGSKVKPQGTRAYNAISAVFGWKAARRAQVLWRKART